MRTRARIAALLAAILAMAAASTVVASPAQATWSPSINECLVFRPLLVQNTSQHACTAAWQGFLKYTLRQTPGLAVDGKFGPATALATARFQLDRGLEGDGKVGPLTWGRIQAECNALHPRACDNHYFY